MATRIVVTLVTCPNKTIAQRIARAIVERRLAACVNILPGVTSLFRWAGKVDQAREVLLLIKTPAHLVPRLRRAILRLHPYDLPEVIALPVIAGHPAYLRWVRESVR